MDALPPLQQKQSLPPPHEELSQKQRIDWGFEFRQYGAALAVAAPLFIILSTYLFFRRGYYDLYIANKVFAGVAAILLGIVLLIGPLSRFFSVFDRFVQYRKELGIVAFFLAIAHGIFSFFFLPKHFPTERFFTSGLWPFIFGLSATVFLIGLLAISTERSMRALGGRLWWPLQYWGIRIAFLFTALHVFIMKWNGWVRWYKVGGGKELAHPEWPGAGLLVGWFIAFVVLIRLAEFGGQRIGRFVWYASIIALPLIFIGTFLWGSRFLP